MEWNWNKYHNVWRNSNSNKQIVETQGKMDIPYTYTCVHGSSILRFGTYISINNSAMEIVLYVSKSYWNDVDMYGACIKRMVTNVQNSTLII